MTDEKSISLGDVIFSGIDQNPYLNELDENILYNNYLRLFQIKRDPKKG
jgi:hypothetical protein